MTGRFLILVGSIFCVIGGGALLWPEALLNPLGVDAASISGRIELRAAYGGMHLALGAFFLFAAGRAGLRRTALLIVALLLGGLVLGRAVGIALDGAPNPVVAAFFGLEVLGALIALGLLVFGRKPDTEPSA